MSQVDTTSMDMTGMTMAADQIAMQSSGSGAIGGVFLVIQIAIYAFLAYSLFILAKKLGEQYAWLAWVPILNIILMFRMAKMSLWWILGLIVPFFNIYVIIKAMHNGISTRTGHGGWWTAGLFFFYIILLPITAFSFKPTETVAQPTTPAV